MDFKKAYNSMLEGKKVKRADWKGYWYINAVTGKLIIHLANGEEITEGDLHLTVQSTLGTDWEVVK